MRHIFCLDDRSPLPLLRTPSQMVCLFRQDEVSHQSCILSFVSIRFLSGDVFVECCNTLQHTARNARNAPKGMILMTMYIHLYIYTYIYIHISLQLHTNIHIIYTYIYIYTHVYTYIHIHAVNLS